MHQIAPFSPESAPTDPKKEYKWSQSLAGSQSLEPILICSLKGHQSGVQSVATSRVGQFIASGGRDKTIKVWNPLNHECITTLEGHQDSVTCLSISSDGQYIVSGSQDMTIKIWNTSTYECVTTLGEKLVGVTSVSISPDSQYFVSGYEDNTIILWDMMTWKCVASLQCENFVTCVSISSYNQYIVSGSDDKTVKVWDLRTRECVGTIVGHHGVVTSVSISSNDQYIVSGSDDKTVKVWDFGTREIVATFEGHLSSVTTVSISSDGQYIVSGSDDKRVKVWKVSTGELVVTFEGHQDSVTCVSISSDGQYIVSGSQDKSVNMWKIPHPDCSIIGNDSIITSVSMSSDGQYIVSGSDDKIVKVWKVSTGELVVTFEGHQDSVTCVSISSDGQYIVSGSQDRTIKIWNTSTYECVTLLSDTPSFVTSVSMSANGQYIVGGSSESVVKVWKWITREIVAILEGHQDRSTCVSISFDGQHVVSGSWDKTLKIWRLSTSKCVATLEGHDDRIASVCFSSDGQNIVSGSDDQTVKVWNLLTRACFVTLYGHRDRVTTVSISSDSQYIVSGSDDKTIKIWKTSICECVFTFFIQDRVSSVCISPDGLSFVSNADQAINICRNFVLKYQCTTPTSLKEFSNSSLNFTNLFSVILVGDDGTSTTTYLNRALHLNSPDQAILELFKEYKPPCWNNLFTEITFSTTSRRGTIIDLLVDQKREATLKIVLDQILFGFDQHNQVRTGYLSTDQAIWRVTPAICVPSFTRSICRLINHYPQLAEYFLSQLGSVKTFVDIDAHELGSTRAKQLLYESVVELKGSILLKHGFGVVGRGRLHVDSMTDDIFASFKETSNDRDHIESRMLPFVDAGGDPGYSLSESSIFHAIVNANRPGLYQNATFRSLVKYKWRTFGWRLFVKKMMIYCIGLFLLMFLLFVRPDPETRQPQLKSSLRYQMSLVFSVLVVLESSWTLYREFNELSVLGVRRYFEEWRNYIDMTVIILSWITGIGILVGWQHHVVSLAFALFLKWLGLLYFLQAFSSTGALVRMVFQIIIDMRHFLYILLIALFAASSAFYALLHHFDPSDGDAGNPFRSPGHTLFFMFNMLLLGDFDMASFVFGEYEVLVQVLFVLSMMFTLIILLNLLIALMSDSYERIQDQSKLAVLELRARALQSLEVFFSPEDRLNHEYFPRYYFLLLPKGDGRMNDLSSEDQWNGVLNALKSEIHDLRDRLEQKEQQMEKSLIELRDAQASGERLMSEKLETILELLRDQRRYSENVWLWMAKVLNWQNIPIVWRCDPEERVGVETEGGKHEQEGKRLVIFYRPDIATERRYPVPSSFENEINEENLTIIFESQLNEFISMESSCASSTADSCHRSFVLSANRLDGIELLRTGSNEQALAFFEELLSKDLQDPIRHFDHSVALYENHQYDEAIKGLKNVISLVRRRNRLPKQQANEMSDQVVPEAVLLYSAYTKLGNCYEAKNRIDRAVASYTLALKAYCPSNSYSFPSYHIFDVGDTQSALSSLLRANGNQDTHLDIEDHLKDYSLSSGENSFNFNCTMCGECCRTSDHILLTPHDIFLLTRSPALRFLGIQTTTGLLSHPRFEGVFHYTKKDLLPICSLRPVKEEKHCKFAYPLYTRNSTDINSNSDRELVPFEESDGITSAGVEIALREGDWMKMMNKSGRQSLGCMLGMLAMPTLCASYPVAPELSQVDFWHVRRVFWRAKRMAMKPLSAGNNIEEDLYDVGSRLASGWQSEENYVVLRNEMCEGFEVQNDLLGDNQSPMSDHHGQSIKSFLSKQVRSSSDDSASGNLTTLERWEESQWFYALLEDISAYLPIQQISFKSIQLILILINRLALIWYNFDTLSSSKSRPIKSYRRLKKDIESLTWILIKETKKFVENLSCLRSSGAEDSQAATVMEEEEVISKNYDSLLQRLHIN